MRKKRTIISLCLSVIMLVMMPHMLPDRVAGQTQTGPKDGANLAPDDLNRIRQGVTAPDFTLENHDGRTFTLSEYRGKRSVVLVFYRGYW